MHGSCGHGYELLLFVKYDEVLDQLSDSQVLKKDFGQ
jgi:hypothetical protein